MNSWRIVFYFIGGVLLVELAPDVKNHAAEIAAIISFALLCDKMYGGKL